MENNSFNFNLVDTKEPVDVIKEQIGVISKRSRGYVSAHIKDYSGPIQSYTYKTPTGLGHVTKGFATEKEVEFDIQTKLGEIGSERHKYEVYLSVKGLPNYKYRMMFVSYGSISYPVTIVLNDDIAEDIRTGYSYTQMVKSLEELEELLNKILESYMFHELVQSMINEALRQEQREAQ